MRACQHWVLASSRRAVGRCCSSSTRGTSGRWRSHHQRQCASSHARTRHTHCAFGLGCQPSSHSTAPASTNLSRKQVARVNTAASVVSHKGIGRQTGTTHVDTEASSATLSHTRTQTHARQKACPADPEFSRPQQRPLQRCMPDSASQFLSKTASWPSVDALAVANGAGAAEHAATQVPAGGSKQHLG